MGSCREGGENGVREQENGQMLAPLPTVLTSLVWLDLVSEFASYLEELLPLSGPPFLSFPRGEDRYSRGGPFLPPGS